MIKNQVENVEIENSEMLLDKLVEIWEDAIFDELQYVYREEKRFIWIIEH